MMPLHPKLPILLTKNLATSYRMSEEQLVPTLCQRIILTQDQRQNIQRRARTLIESIRAKVPNLTRVMFKRRVKKFKVLKTLEYHFGY
ncbi:MAG: hypothetical protein ACRYGR_02485 [Janthinobacterium lividum]